MAGHHLRDDRAGLAVVEIVAADLHCMLCVVHGFQCRDVDRVSVLFVVVKECGDWYRLVWF